MGDHKNLSDNSATDKIKELAEDIKSCMFCTYKNTQLQSRPMSVQEIDDHGHLWFLSDKNSNKNSEINENPQVEIFFCENHNKYLSLSGKASISYDREKIEKLWNPILKVWMQGGVDDPNLSVIKVIPDDEYY